MPSHNDVRHTVSVVAEIRNWEYGLNKRPGKAAQTVQ
jgi:hypothetical protein